MSYNEGINYDYHGDMWAALATPDTPYVAKATNSEYLAYLCFSNQLYDDAGIATPYLQAVIAGEDDNIYRPSCPTQH